MSQIPVQVKGYFSVKREGDYSWPLPAYAGNSRCPGWEADPARTIHLFDDDVLTKAPDGTYSRFTGLGCSNIVLADEDVVFHPETARLALHVK